MPVSARHPDVAIVIPALNERANLERLLPELTAVLQTLNLNAEIIVVDGGSADGTPEAVARHGARAVPQLLPGYGGALREGFLASSAPYILTLDADLSHPPSAIPGLWNERHSADVLVASRYVDGGHGHPAFRRRFLSQMLNRAYARTLSLPISDLSSRFRLYRRPAIAGLAMQAQGFDALAEILIRVYTQGWHIREIPFQDSPRAADQSAVDRRRLGPAFLATLVRMYRLRNSVVSADYDNRAFDSPIWLQRHWQRTRYRIVMDMLDDREHVLDVGCGSGRIILDLPDAVGIDILHRKLRWLRPHHRLLVCGSATQLPFRDGAFSSVVCSEVIEHIPDTPDVLGEITRVLRPGGLLVLGTPDYGRWVWPTIEWAYGKVAPDAYADEHITHYTRESLARRLVAAGYEILDCRYLMSSVMIFKARKGIPVTHPNGSVQNPRFEPTLVAARPTS